MVAEAKHRGASVRRAVAADALEDAEPVVEGVGEDVDVRVGPVHERAVQPDRLAADPHSHRFRLRLAITGGADAR